MKVESTLPRVAVPPSREGVCRRLVLQVLGGMPLGRLTLVLPDGGRLRFGAAAVSPATPRGREAARVAQPAEIIVRRERFFTRCVLGGDVGFGEAFVEGDWDTPDIAAVIAWFVLNHEHTPTLAGSRVGVAGLNLLRVFNRALHRLRPNSRRRAGRNIREHYDLSNEFFALWLDPSLMYSAARWTTPTATLAEAQRTKNEALCAKLRLTAADHVLELGTGWGGWALYAARNYGCRITTLTLSPAQRDAAVARIAAAGLSDRIEVRLQDYRALPPHERYDKVVSIEMLEAVGHAYLPAWCGVVARALKPDGLLALQYIACPDARYGAFRRGVDFIQKHVFPGSLLLSTNRLNAELATAGGFMLHGLEDFGPDYARTLAAWRETFNAQLPAVHALGFDARFVRKWNYYLAYCEAAFALRNITVVQTVHTRPNNLSV